MTTLTKRQRRLSRSNRTHAMARASGHPRLVVYRSNRTVSAQIVDDSQGKVLCGASGLKSKKSGIEAAKEVGATIAKLAQDKKISAISFDRNGYQYHGQIKALADAAREGGLKF